MLTPKVTQIKAVSPHAPMTPAQLKAHGRCQSITMGGRK